MKKKKQLNKFLWLTLFIFSVFGIFMLNKNTSEAACSHRYTAKRTYSATCTGKGRTETICASCREVLATTYTSALGHSWKAATCSVPMQCSRCSIVSGQPLGHKYSAATCTSPKKCTKCGTTSGSSLGHSYSAATCTSAKKCTRCGTTSGSSLGHSYSAATCTSAKKCTRCGTTSGSSLGHNYSAATCTSAKKCTRCGTTSGSSLGHNYSSATCTSPKTCTRCGTTSGSSLGHNYSSATCTSPKTCTRCGTTSGSSLGHNYSSATCTSPKTCTRCGTTSGSSLGHSYSAATCTSPKTCTRCGTTSGYSFGHSYAAATCTSPQKCTRCGGTTGSSLGHNYAAATCTSPKTCTRCGTTSGSSLGHNYSAATCTSAKKCTRCNTTSGSALGHNYTAATCTSGMTCVRCNSTSYPALGHDYTFATCNAAKECTRCGITSGSPLGHNYADATCTSAKKCTRCGLTSGSALGHSYTSATCTTPKTCTRCSGTSGTALGHSYTEATCTAAKKCTKCGGVSGSALGHNYTAATCTAAKKCTRCSTTSGTALGHSWNTWVEIKAATCTTTGSKKRTCSRTNCSAYETATISELGHISNGVISKVNPTCSKDGYTAYICSRTACGAEFHKTVLKKTGNHNWSLYSVLKASTCTEKGTSIYRCSACATTESRTTDALGHISNGVITETKKPTCTEDGRKEMLCTRCNTGLGNPAIVKATGHDWRLYSVLKASTCTEKGTSVYRCNTCATTESRTTDYLEHTYKEKRTEPTCTATGSVVLQCSCGDIKSQTALAAKGHLSSGKTKTVNPTCKTEGYTAEICSVETCKAEFNKKTLAKTTDHAYKLQSVLKASTCTEKGTSVYKCSVCGTTDSRTTDILGHTYEEKRTEPTCTATGSIFLQCSCGDIKSQTTLAAKGHLSSGKTKTVNPTCKTEGYTVEICSVETCKAEFNKTTLAKTTSHNWEFYRVVELPTCTKTGSIIYRCSVCETDTTMVLNKVDHVESTTWFIETTATCIKAGTRIKSCQNCPTILKTETYFGTHTYDKEVIKVEPTTKTTGKKVMVCSVCDDEDTDNIITLDKVDYDIISGSSSFDFMGDGSINPGFPHTVVDGDWLKLTIESNAKWNLTAIDKNGTAAEYVNFKVNSEEINSNTVTGSAGLTYVYIKLDALTPDSGGPRSGKLVFSCGGETIVYPISQGCDHVYTDYVVTQEPTPEKAGIETATCTFCGNPISQEIKSSFEILDRGCTLFEFNWSGACVRGGFMDDETKALSLMISAPCDWTMEMEDKSLMWIYDGSTRTNKIEGSKGITTVLIKPTTPYMFTGDIYSKLIFKCAGQVKEYDVIQVCSHTINGQSIDEHRDYITRDVPFGEATAYTCITQSNYQIGYDEDLFLEYLFGKKLTNGVKVFKPQTKSGTGFFYAINVYQGFGNDVKVDYLVFKIQHIDYETMKTNKNIGFEIVVVDSNNMGIRNSSNGEPMLVVQGLSDNTRVSEVSIRNFDVVVEEAELVREAMEDAKKITDGALYLLTIPASAVTSICIDLANAALYQFLMPDDTPDDSGIVYMVNYTFTIPDDTSLAEKTHRLSVAFETNISPIYTLNFDICSLFVDEGTAYTHEFSYTLNHVVDALKVEAER